MYVRNGKSHPEERAGGKPFQSEKDAGEPRALRRNRNFVAFEKSRERTTEVGRAFVYVFQPPFIFQRSNSDEEERRDRQKDESPRPENSAFRSDIKPEIHKKQQRRVKQSAERSGNN